MLQCGVVVAAIGMLAAQCRSPRASVRLEWGAAVLMFLVTCHTKQRKEEDVHHQQEEKEETREQLHEFTVTTAALLPACATAG